MRIAKLLGALGVALPLLLPASVGAAPGSLAATPATPVITEPSFDNAVLNPADVHMQAGGFSDPSGDVHACSDWQIWSVSAAQPVWQADCAPAILKVHIHLGDGVFENALAGQKQLANDTDYLLKVRFKDDAGDLSAWATRPFHTSKPGPQGEPGPVPWIARHAGFRVERAATGFKLPSAIAFVPNAGPAPGDPLYYVAELYGDVKVVTRDGTVRTYASALLNFDPTGPFPGSGETGIGGVAVDPASGDLFVALPYQDTSDPALPMYGKVIRLASADGGLTAASETTILDMAGETAVASHLTSDTSIGPDGKLYVHNGDGFSSSKATNLDSFLGKILRLNLDGTAPPDNPFYDAADGIGAKDYVYAYGFRNPFGGAWRGSDGTHFEVENGPANDRLAKVTRGTSYAWNGTNASMRTGALFNWGNAHAPVGLAFAQASTFGGSGLPSSWLDHAFVGETGPTYANGPQPLGKRLSELAPRPDGTSSSPARAFLEYKGVGRATVSAVEAGPDGLYFADLYKDVGASSAIDPGASIWRISYVGPAAWGATLTSPTDNSTLSAPADIPIAADVADTIGSVTKVDFYAGNTLLATDTTAPYSFTFADAPEGTYAITAVATDDGGGSTASEPVHVVARAPTPGYADTVVADSPAGYWRLGESAGVGMLGEGAGAEATDRSGNGRNGLYVNDVTLGALGALANESDSAMSVAGLQLSQYVEVPYADSLNPAGAFTVEAWAKVAGDAGQFRSLVSSRDTVGGNRGYTLYANGSDRWEFRAGLGASWLTLTGPAVTLGAWVHLAATLEPISGGVRARLYVNGGLVAEQTASSPFVRNIRTALRIGAGQNEAGPSFMFNGALDEVAVYGRALPAARLALHNNEGRGLGNLSATLTGPPDGSSYTAPATIPLAASAAAGSGSVTKVDFYRGSTLVGTATTAPYTFSWTDVPAGTYSINAVATDDHGTTAASAPVDVAVFDGSSAYANAVLGDGAVALWRLGESVGKTAFERTAAHRNGTYKQAPALGVAGVLAGDPDTAVTFDGSTQYAEVPFASALDPAGAFSVEAWAKPTGGAGTYRSVVTSRNPSPPSGYILYAGSDNRWQFWAGGGTAWIVARGSTVALNTWAHLVGTVEPIAGGGARVRLYVNGALAGDVTSTSNAVANASKPLRIGAGQTEGTPGFFFPGAIDEVAVYSTTLPPEKIASHYQTARGSLSVSLTSPPDGASYSAPATIPLRASAAGAVTKVEFFQGTTLLGTATSAPYAFDWTNVTAGTYSLTAVATDAGGHTLASSAVTVQVFASSSYANAVLADGPSAYWRLGETLGTTVFDRSANGRLGAYAHGPALGGAGSVADDPDTSVAFDGSSAYAEVPFAAAVNPPSGFTVEAWARVTGGAGTYRSVVTSRTGTPTTGYMLYAASDNRWEFRAGNASTWLIARGGTVAQSVWTHLVGTVEAVGGGTRVRLYVNGSLLGETTNASTFARNASRPLRIGAGQTEAAPGFFFSGGVDEVAVYPSALAATRIAAHYLAAKGTLTVSLTAPADGASYVSPTSIGLTASAGGPVAKVDFLDGTTLLGTASSAPYALTWSNPSVGTHRLSAVASDDLGNTATSALATVQVFGPSTYAAGVLADGPVGYWRLGETAGTIAFDRAAGHRDGTYKQSPGAASGALAGDADGAASFDGSTQYEETPYAAALDPPGGFTVEAWARPTGGAGTYRSVVTSRNTSPASGYMLYAASDNRWEFRAGNASTWLIARGGSVALNAWTYLVGTAEPLPGGSVRIRLYVNGALTGETTTAGALARNPSRPLRIGAGQTEGAPGFFFPGALDEVAVYDSALTQARVRAHYANASGP